MKKDKIQWRYMIILVIVMSIAEAQLINDLHIQSKKFSALQGYQTQVTVNKVNYQIPYQTAFTIKPDVGLSVYSLQFDYNPQFSINVVQQLSNNTILTFYVSGQPSDSSIYNELYIMYIATDFEQMGIYMPGPKNTTAELGIPTTVANRSQEITFNFKNVGTSPIFPPTTNVNNIKVTVFLTGIEAQSQTIQNGYSKNYAYFSLGVSKITSNFYTILVSVRSSFGDVQIRTIQFTVVYFDINQLAPTYQMNSNSINAINFGGTFYMSSISLPLDPLPQNSSYQNILQYFFGISSIQCSQGDTINLLAVQSFNYNTNGLLQNLVLTFQTQRNTYISSGLYNYIQYKPKTCTGQSSTCTVPCNDSAQPSYPITNLENQCARCLYFCKTCENGFNCSGCPATRNSNGVGICVCANNTLYDDQSSLECQSCFGTKFCNICSRVGVCETCYIDNNFTLNPVLRICQCSPGSYASQEIMKINPYPIAFLSSTCKPCPPNCIYCESADTCQACTVPTYLASKFIQINGVNETCSPICNVNQIFNPTTRKCQFFNGDFSLFDSAGRLGFDWSHMSQENEMVINLVFSQRNISYYFFENSQAYQYTNLGNLSVPGVGLSALYYDDGNGYMAGYVVGGGSSSDSSAVINTGEKQGSGFNFDNSALRGEYYGLGEAEFFRQEYLKYQPQAQYFDQFLIPFGKHKLNTTTISSSATFLDAIRNNLDFVIGGQSLPYTIRAVSPSQLQLIVRPQKSYLTTQASLIFKNPALIRSGETALQTAEVSKQIDRLDFYTLSQLQNAIGLRDRTQTVVQILWGICKYLLFIGFGWVVMPLMLSLQYIFCHNYITTQLPLNLYHFLTAFKDFRNPSILFNPQRNQFDARVVNHLELYKNIPIYEIFDRGIDFMKNSWEFFFVPILSFGLLFLLIGINWIINKLCRRDIPIISKYLQKRAFLHAGAYTLVQALPVSFFFFGQLQDTRYQSIHSPTAIYPSFNTGMAYASFFVSAILPLILLVWIYNYFKNRARSGKFQLNKVKQKDDGNVVIDDDPALIGDPLWTGNPERPISYFFAASVFYVPLLAGFVVSFFSNSYPWQLTGLLLGNAALASFAAASQHFESKIPQFFFVGIGVLMVGYQLIHAGIGSNRALSTYDQWNTGYLGIGIIYAIILVSLIFSGYLMYKLLTSLYNNIIKPKGCFPKVSQLVSDGKNIQDEQMNQRDKIVQKVAKRKTTILQSKLSYLQPNGSQQRLGREIKQQGGINIIDANNLHQELEFQSTREDGRSNFRCKNSNRLLVFPRKSSKLLVLNMPLIIDSEDRIFAEDGKKQLGTVSKLMKINEQNESQQQLINISPTIRRQQTSIPPQIQMMPIQSNKTTQQLNILPLSQDRIKINGNEINFEFDQKYFYLLNYNNNPKVQINDQQFINLMNKNKNVVKYQNQNYFIEVCQNPNFYFLLNTNSHRRVHKLPMNTLRSLFADKPRKIFINSQSNPIILTKKTQQYLINGKMYEKIAQDSDNYYFKDIKNGQKLTLKRSQSNFEQIKTYQKIGSQKQLDNKFKKNPQIIFENQKYLYQNKQNDKYLFINANTKKGRLFTSEQLFNILGYHQTSLILQSQIKSNSIDKNQPLLKKQQSHKGSLPKNMTSLKLIQTDKQRDLHIYINPLTNQTYQMPAQLTDINQNVYIDKDGHIWHKNQMVAVESDSQLQSSLKRSSTSNKVMNSQLGNQNQRNSANTIQSSSTIQISKNINPDHMYNIKVFKQDYVYNDDNLSSSRDIQEVRLNVQGSNVPNVVEELMQANPERKILVEGITRTSEKFIIQ